MFPVTAVNCLKIQQYSLRNLLCYRKNCLCETASTCSAEFLQRISVRKGAGGLTPVKTDKAEGFVKIQSTGNASSTLSCLPQPGRICVGEQAVDAVHIENFPYVILSDEVRNRLAVIAQINHIDLFEVVRKKRCKALGKGVFDY